MACSSANQMSIQPLLPHSYKTIFLIDESPLFFRMSCQQKVDLDLRSMRGRPNAPNQPPLELEKSLWTCALEAISEYARIVYDIFPNGERLINMSSGLMGKNDASLTWGTNDQSLQALSSYMAKLSFNIVAQSYTNSTNNYTNLLYASAKKAVDLLGTLSELQTILKTEHRERFVNKGRIICIGFFQSQAEIQALQAAVSVYVTEFNNCVRAENGRKALIDIDLVIVNSFPINDNSSSTLLSDVPSRQLAPALTSEVICSRSGTYLAQKLVSLVLRHYNLASTTVSGIPMKEEQNATSSANYDVEILHTADAHFELHQLIENEDVQILKEGCDYNTIPLKWCTPKSTSLELQFTTNACRITPVDVNSRPSSCLTNFLLGGRNVKLELLVGNQKVTSHMLASHNKELYIHTLSSSRSILDDPPSISSGVGGSVEDYRINDFANFCQRNRLVRCRSGLKPNDFQLLPDKTLPPLKRQTLYWPMTMGSTIMMNVQGQLHALLNYIPHQTLTSEQINECQSAIFNIVNMESRGMALSVPKIYHRGPKSGPKKEELYRLLWAEVEYFIQKHAISPEHYTVLACAKGVHSYDGQDVSANKKLSDIKVKLESSRDVDLRVSDEPAEKKVKTYENWFANCNGQLSLYTIWMNKLKKQESEKHKEFAGVLSAIDGKTELYKDLKLRIKEENPA